MKKNISYMNNVCIVSYRINGKDYINK